MKSSVEDSLITTLLYAAFDYANSYCGREFAQCNYELLECDFDFTIPCVPMSDFKLYYKTDTDYVEISSADYVIDYTCIEPKVVFLDGVVIPTLLNRPDAVKATYTGGFTTSTIPSSVKIAILMKVASLYDNRAEENKRFATTADVLLNAYKVYTV